MFTVEIAAEEWVVKRQRVARAHGRKRITTPTLSRQAAEIQSQVLAITYG